MSSEGRHSYRHALAMLEIAHRFSRQADRDTNDAVLFDRVARKYAHGALETLRKPVDRSRRANACPVNLRD
jgi:hypothetical protein